MSGCGECDVCTNCFADPDPDGCPNCGSQTFNRDCIVCMEAYRAEMEYVDRTAFGYDPGIPSGDPDTMKTGAVLRAARRAGLPVVTIAAGPPSWLDAIPLEES